MKKYIYIILLVVVCFGDLEVNLSKTDFYQMGMDAARQNFKPKYSFALGAAMPNPIIYVVLNLIYPVKVEIKYNQILSTNNGKIILCRQSC